MSICTRMCDDSTTEHATRKPPTGPKPRQPIHKINQQSIATYTMTKSTKRNKSRSPGAKITENNSKGTKYSSSPRQEGRDFESFSESINEYSITSDEDQKDTSSGSSSPQRELLFSAYRGSNSSTLSENSFSQSKVAEAVIKAEYYEQSSPQNQSSFFWLVIIGVGIVMCWFITPNTWCTKLPQPGIGELFDEVKFINDMSGLKNVFPSQNDNIWTELITGIKDVADGANKPAIFLLLSSHDETTNCLARKVAKVVRSALKGEGELILMPEKLENNSSRALEYEEQIRQSKAVIVLDLLSIQPEALKGFHDILDHHNPVVDEAVYLITMQSKLYDMNSPDNDAVEYAEQQLRDKFSEVILADKLEPLIVRITAGGILPIREETTFPCK